LLIKERRSVQAVHDIKSVAMGPGVARFKAEVAFHPTALGLVYLQTGANQAELLRSFQIARCEWLLIISNWLLIAS
jgi:hypothetical protein